MAENGCEPKYSAPNFGALRYKVSIYNKGESYLGSRERTEFLVPGCSRLSFRIVSHSYRSFAERSTSAHLKDEATEAQRSNLPKVTGVGG